MLIRTWFSQEGTNEEGRIWFGSGWVGRIWIGEKGHESRGLWLGLSMEFWGVHRESSVCSSDGWGETEDKVGYWVVRAGGPWTTR